MSEFNYAIVFSTDHSSSNVIFDNVYHLVWLTTLPSISSLKSIFDELLNDNDFGMNDKEFIDSLTVSILHRDDLFKLNFKFKELYPPFNE